MNVYKLFLSFWCIILLTITIFLCNEFLYFKQQAYALSQLKDEYATYVLALKKLISEYEVTESQTAVKQGVGDQKKKPLNNEQEKQFSAVNREFAYLRQGAIAFARKENVQESVRALYAQDTDVVNSGSVAMKTVRSKKRTLVARRKKIDQTKPLAEHLKKLQREPIFILPVEKANFWISSLFGPRKKPNGTWGFHQGIDMAAIKGTPVKAAGAGVVIQAAFMPGYGNTIVIAHNRKFKTRYAHLSVIKVHVGQHVEQGELIGKVGATGSVRKSKKGDGSHLHFEVYVFGKQQNPFYYLQH